MIDREEQAKKRKGKKKIKEKTKKELERTENIKVNIGFQKI